MDPNQNMNVAGAAGAAPVQSVPSAPAASENIMAQGVSEKKKGGKGMLYGMILLAVLAIGGIGFGIWAWMDGNAQKDTLNSQIADLKAQNTKLLEQINDDEKDIDAEYKNPTIKSSNSEKEYRVWLDSSSTDEGSMKIGVKDGKVDNCQIYNNTHRFDRECTIDGISGEIYDVIEIWYGPDNSDSNIGFIMTDGTVQYFPLYAAMENNDFSIKGTLAIDGFVVDAIHVSTNLSEATGWSSIIFVLKDGSFIEYNESMLK